MSCSIVGGVVRRGGETGEELVDVADALDAAERVAVSAEHDEVETICGGGERAYPVP